MFSLVCAWIHGRVNNREAGDLRRHRAHYDVIVMFMNHHASVYTNYDQAELCLPWIAETCVCCYNLLAAEGDSLAQDVFPTLSMDISPRGPQVLLFLSTIVNSLNYSSKPPKESSYSVLFEIKNTLFIYWHFINDTYDTTFTNMYVQNEGSPKSKIADYAVIRWLLS